MAMTGMRDAAPAARLPALPRIRRSDDGRVVAGVCAGIAQTLRVDVTLVRLVFVVLAFAGGSGIALYLAAWLVLPSPESNDATGARRVVGIALAAAAALLALRGLGLAGSFVWAGVMIAIGIVLVSKRPRSRPKLALGALLVIAGTVIVGSESDQFGGEGGLVEPGAIAIALAAIVGPSLWRLVQERDAERLERTRSEERAELAARVHDSVLQTLALVQREAHDPRRVTTLARAQERELRSWLYGGRARGGALAAAIEGAAAEIEDMYGVRIEVVAAGDAPLDDRLEALVLAAREAMTNAAKFAGAATISVYVEARADGANVFVRDTGAGFDRASVPPDRRGLRESIENRLERHGGRATIVSAPGAGTEVELTMPRSEA